MPGLYTLSCSSSGSERIASASASAIKVGLDGDGIFKPFSMPETFAIGTKQDGMPSPVALCRCVSVPLCLEYCEVDARDSVSISKRDVSNDF
jgi:hypothetical protein